jgi:hypothetical protein
MLTAKLDQLTHADLRRDSRGSVREKMIEQAF